MSVKSILSLFAFVFVTACSSSGIIKPEVTVVGMNVERASLWETTARFDVRVDNENEFDLEVEKSSHLLEVNGVRLGRGLSNEGFTIPAFSSTKIPVVVNVSNTTILSRLGKLTSNQALDYRISSVLYPKGQSGKIKVFQQGRFGPQ